MTSTTKLTDEQKEKIGQLVGEATGCWDNLKNAGVFDSTRASEIIEEIFAVVEGAE
jgi:hypothetical protein